MYNEAANRKWIVLVSATAVVLTALVLLKPNASAQPQADNRLLLSGSDFTTAVAYQIGLDNGELVANINYDDPEAYRAFNQQEAAKIAQSRKAVDTIPVKITFSRALDEAEFTRFVTDYDIDVTAYIIYMREPDGKIATIQGSPSATELIPAAFFNAATQSIAHEYNSHAAFIGWVEVDGVIQVRQLADLQAEPKVFLVDVMEPFLTTKVTNEALAEIGVPMFARRRLLRAGFASIYRTPVAWQLYEQHDFNR